MPVHSAYSAYPSPTQYATFSVAERIERSCPPPFRKLQPCSTVRTYIVATVATAHRFGGCARAGPCRAVPCAKNDSSARRRSAAHSTDLSTRARLADLMMSAATPLGAPNCSKALHSNV